MDQKQPTVSIILPIYNAGDLLRTQVDSILAQTYPVLELLLVDDGSTDKSPDIAQEYADNYPFVRFQRNEVNRGVSATVSQAVSQVVGDLIALSDHDDIWVPDKISRQVAYLTSHPDVVCVFSDRIIIDLEEHVLCASEYACIGTPPEVADTTFLLASMARYTPANTLMFRGELVDAIFPISRGWDWWIASVASWFGLVAFMRDSLVSHRVYEGSASSNYRLYLKGGHLRTTRLEIKENVRRHYENAAALHERGSQLGISRSLLASLENWLNWYQMLLDLLTDPNWRSYRSGMALLPKVGKREWFKLTLYALPLAHEAYLRVRTKLRDG